MIKLNYILFIRVLKEIYHHINSDSLSSRGVFYLTDEFIF
jgi:hypothetical protein